MDCDDEEINLSWDIDKYRKDFENEDHWKLRRAFMQAHKDKFSEDELVCLAAVFTNMEFLGCRYPAETMKMVSELSKSVSELDKYRASRKHNLKRTFIRASDAAQDKAEGKKTKIPSSEKKSKSSDEEDEEELKCQPKKPSILLTQEQRKDSMHNLLKDVIFFDIGYDDINSSVNKTIDMMKKKTPVDVSYDDQTMTYRYVFHGQIIGEGTGTNKKTAKKLADENLVETFKTHCYTIKSKLKFFTTESVITRSDQSSNLAETKVDKLQSDNLGFKMLKMLGWSGGSLGSGKTDGIIDPISLEIRIGRLGLGSDAGPTFNIKYFRNLLNNYKKNSVEYDLVFSSEFTKEERAQIHNVASKLGFRTKSYGKDGNRHIVISSNISPETIKQKLLMGDPILQEKYELIPPRIS